MTTTLPHALSMPVIGSLPGNMYRIKKITHWANDRDIATQGRTRRISLNAPPNYYLLGHSSTVEFTVRVPAGTQNPQNPAGNTNLLTSGDTASPDFNPENRWRILWGCGAPWSRVRETVNSGSFCIESITDPDAVQPIYASRGLCTRRVPYFIDQELTLQGTAARTNFPGAVNGNYPLFKLLKTMETGKLNISTLECAGFASDSLRSRIAPVEPWDGTPGGSGEAVDPDGRGFAYTVPLTAYSRLAQIELLPLGLIGSYASEGMALEFTVQEAIKAISNPNSVGGNPAIGGIEVLNLRVNATYMEVMDEDVQRAIEALYKKTEKLSMGPGVEVPLRLELPFVNYSYSTHLLRAGTFESILTVNSNSPSVRGLMISGRPGAASQGDLFNSPIRWTGFKVVVGGHCIFDCGYETRDQNSIPQIQSDLYTEYNNASHLFSIFDPKKEAIVPESVLGYLQCNVSRSNEFRPITIACSFENSPHHTTDTSEVSMSRGVDLRNVGSMQIHLRYQDAYLDMRNPPVALPAPGAIIDVTLAHDMVVSVDRSGCHDITNSSL